MAGQLWCLCGCTTEAHVHVHSNMNCPIGNIYHCPWRRVCEEEGVCGGGCVEEGVCVEGVWRRVCVWRVCVKGVCVEGVCEGCV